MKATNSETALILLQQNGTKHFIIASTADLIQLGKHKYQYQEIQIKGIKASLHSNKPSQTQFESIKRNKEP